MMESEGASIPLKSFYGSGKNSYRKKRKLENVEKTFQSHPLYAEYQPKLHKNLPRKLWKTFHRQEEAFSFLSSTNQDLRVFSAESKSFDKGSGQRLYFVTSLAEFWARYRQLSWDRRCHYEVIPEGSACKLYFDLEFLTEYNPKKNGNEMTLLFINFVLSEIKLAEGLDVSADQVIVLDSSTKEKFSQHLIFNIPNVAFRNNIIVGNFVKHIAHKLRLPLGPPNKTPCCAESGFKQTFSREELSSLFVFDKKGNTDLFVDLGVYTKNRNFRLYLSSKLGKNNPLLHQSLNKNKERFNSQEERFFVDTLITNVGFSALIGNGFAAPVRSTSDSKNDFALSTDQNKLAVTNSLDGFFGSPYPDLDDFIKRKVSAHGMLGKIRRWTYFSTGQLLLYEISNYRYCENIGRPHKSNNIMLIADLSNGKYFQKCHDPDCRAIDFKSVEQNLPDHVLPAAYFEDILNDDFDCEMTDDEIIIASDKIECNLRKNDLSNDSKSNDISDADLIKAAEYIESSF